MWLPTFLQRGIHFFGERTEVLAFNNFVLFDRVHLPIIGKRAAVVEEDLLSVRESVRAKSKHANVTLVAVPGPESRSVTHRGWKTLLRNSANNMLTRPPYDVPRANFADNPVGFRCLPFASSPAAADLDLVR